MIFIALFNQGKRSKNHNAALKFVFMESALTRQNIAGQSLAFSSQEVPLPKSKPEVEYLQQDGTGNLTTQPDLSRGL